MVGKKTDKRLPASERREIILEAAMRTFVEYGYYGAHMDVVAERSDVTKPILYRHFPSKLKLLLAIIERAGEELLASYSQTREEELDWATHIKLDVGSYLDFVEGYGAGFILIYSQGLSIDREVTERLLKIRNDYRELLTERIRSYTDTDAVSPEEIELRVAMITGMSESAAVHWMSNDSITRDICENNLANGVIKMLYDLPQRRGRQAG
jgi:AcrR family transcriptional regulator